MTTSFKNQPLSLTRRLVRWCLLGIAAGLLVIFTLGVVDMIRGPQVVEHTSRESAPFDLPPDAADICYVTRPPTWPNRAFEFTVSESAFVRWAGENGYALQEIGAEPYSVLRYTFTSPDPEDHYAHVTNGLFYQWTEEDMGTYVVYDRDKQRAYFHDHSR